MGVYPGGTTMSSAPAAEGSYYVTSPPAAGPPVYPLAPFYGQQTYPVPAGRTASDPSAVSQQVRHSVRLMHSQSQAQAQSQAISQLINQSAQSVIHSVTSYQSISQ